MNRSLVAVLSVLALGACGFGESGIPDEVVEGVPGSSAATPAVTGVPTLEVTATVIATGFRIPWGMAFLPDGTALVTERGNAVPGFGLRDDPGGVAERDRGPRRAHLRGVPEGSGALPAGPRRP